MISCAAAIACISAVESPNAGMVQWPFYGGDQGGDEVFDAEGYQRSETCRGCTWRGVGRPGETALPQYGTRPGMFENTPIMIDDVLYLSTPYNKVVALNAETGDVKWSYDPKAYEMGQPANGTGYVHRGVAAWRDGGKLRIFMNSRYRLICLDAQTGKPVNSFGDNGVVDLSQGLVWPINKLHYTETSPPVVYKNIVIVGNGVGDRLVYRNDPPGDVRGFRCAHGQTALEFSHYSAGGRSGQ